MSHAYSRNHLPIIFGTKGRRANIKPAVQEHLWAYIRGIARNYKMDLEAIGGTDNHVHLLLVLPPKLSLSHALRAIKANSSKWMNENGHLFAWQEGYAAFSVSASLVEAVSEYIRNQPEHHKKRTFEQECLMLLKKHGIVADAGQVFG
ncbi:MAG: IS200/IS605 family transposase [Terriglobales bacterium]